MEESGRLPTRTSRAGLGPGHRPHPAPCLPGRREPAGPRDLPRRPGERRQEDRGLARAGVRPGALPPQRWRAPLRGGRRAARAGSLPRAPGRHRARPGPGPDRRGAARGRHHQHPRLRHRLQRPGHDLRPGRARRRRWVALGRTPPDATGRPAGPRRWDGPRAGTVLGGDHRLSLPRRPGCGRPGPRWARERGHARPRRRAGGRDREPVLAAALRVLATEEGASAHLASLAAALPPADVLRGLHRLAQEQGQLSSHALRMAQALAEAHEDLPPTEGLPEPPADFAAMAALFREEDVDRYNPEDHRALLAQKPTLDLAAIAVELAADPDAFGPDTERDDAVERRVVTTLLDMNAVSPDAVRPLVLGRLRDILLRARQANRF